MYEDIMRRPMFQTPQQRAGGGIMRGVAPVQGYQEGGEINPFGMPGSSAGQVPEESLSNGLADTAFKLLVVDYNDPVDVALATITAGLMATGVAAPVAALTAVTRLGLKGRKVKQVLDRAQSVGEKLAKPTENASFRNPLGEVKKDAGIFSKVTAPVVSNMAVRETDDIVTDPVGYASDWADTGRAAVDLGDAVYDVATEDDEGVFSETMKGIASLPVRMADGGDIDKVKKSSALEKFFELLTEKVRRGEIDEVEADKIITTSIDDVAEAQIARNKVLGKEVAEEIKKRREIQRAVERANTGTGGPKSQPKPPTKPKTKSKSETEKPKDKPKDKSKTEQEKTDKSKTEQEFDGKGRKGFIRRHPWLTGGGTVALAPGIAGVVDEYAGTEIGPKVTEAYRSAAEILGEGARFGLETLGEGADAFISGYRGEDTEEEKEETPFAPTPDPSLYRPNIPVTTKPSLSALTASTPPQEEREKVLPGFRPFGGKIARALLGEDEAFGGDRGAIDFIRGGDYMGKVMSALSDPKMRYQLSQAAKATEGFVPRNFFTDIEEAGQAYDDMVAQRDYLEAQTRDVDRTDMEKTVDYYIDSLKAADPDMSNEEASKFRLELNSLFQKQNLDAAQMQTILTIFESVPNAETAQSIFDKLNIDPSVTTAIANILRGRGQV